MEQNCFFQSADILFAVYWWFLYRQHKTEHYVIPTYNKRNGKQSEID